MDLCHWMVIFQGLCQLKYTGSAQTFIAENTVKFSPESFQEAYVFLSGMLQKKTPLHAVYLKSDILLQDL